MELSSFGHDCPLRCSPMEKRPPGTYGDDPHKVKAMSRMFLILFSAVALCAVISAAPSRQKRGFRNAALSTARGFRKEDAAVRRDGAARRPLQVTCARALVTRHQAPIVYFHNYNWTGAIPMASTWFAEQVARSPALAKYLVEKVIDQNGDGLIHPDEVYQSL
ncbi:EF-hand domain-containing protein [Caerostris extrusa]|uniref:EF-hand domain-containing protein n=1 Tax=Caerostris extrusa TaxID=172846 RepID=A0AAV4NXP7_CAEEX|nr:EF-hand domain-containing protein [Caerostris extrusa]